VDSADPATARQGPPGADEPMPVGAWVRLFLPQQPEVIGFTYVDRVAGFSARGGPADDPHLADRPALIVRLPGFAWQPLGEEEVARLGLPARPAWVEQFYGPQPAPGTLWGWWRGHPKLRGRFHPEAPDDLQVLVHDGGPRLTDRRPELVWVRVTGGEGDVFTGTVLNQPHQLVSVAQGSAIRFLVPEGGEHPLLVTEKYLRERPDWEVAVPCNRCGLTELFDAPSDLRRAVFPHLPKDFVQVAFTAFCGACGGTLLVKHKGAGGDAPAPEPPPRKKWWQFWK
jgi:hypothetical protein